MKSSPSTTMIPASKTLPRAPGTLGSKVRMAGRTQRHPSKQTAGIASKMGRSRPCPQTGKNINHPRSPTPKVKPSVRRSNGGKSSSPVVKRRIAVPAPREAAVINKTVRKAIMIGAAGNSFLDSQSNQEYGPQHIPPVDQRPHLGIPDLLRRIDLRHRRFRGPNPQLQNFHQQVDLELVVIEP